MVAMPTFSFTVPVPSLSRFPVYRYRKTNLGGCSEFVLSSQGHIQALVNPSGNPKGEYRTNREAIGVEMSADEWHDGSESHRGSWWDHWTLWLKPRSGRRVAAPAALGNENHPVLVEAPGTYVYLDRQHTHEYTALAVTAVRHADGIRLGAGASK